MKFTLLRKRQEADEATTFFWSADNHLSYRAGQHVSVKLPHQNPDQRGIVRTFTLSSSPTEPEPTITTKRGPSSFKQTLFNLVAGSEMEVNGPTGNLILDESNPVPRVFLAGGIGITPFHSILRFVADRKLSVPITLLYSNKTPQEIVFRKELEEISQSAPSVKIIHTITRPEEGKEEWNGRIGRIDEAFIHEAVPDLNTPIFGIAGPETMVEGMINLIKGLGVPTERILFEKFPGY